MRSLTVECVMGALLGLVIATPAQAQTIDAAVEVASGFRSFSADVTVEVLTGLAFSADEKWEVVGTCTNSPSVKVDFVTGIAATNADLKVQIVQGRGALTANRRVCITNASSLDEKTLRLLKLVDE